MTRYALALAVLAAPLTAQAEYVASQKDARLEVAVRTRPGAGAVLVVHLHRLEQLAAARYRPLAKKEILAGEPLRCAVLRERTSALFTGLPPGAYSAIAFADLDGDGRIGFDPPEPLGWYAAEPGGRWAALELKAGARQRIEVELWRPSPLPRGERRTAHGILREIRGHHVLQLWGSAAERGRAHGYLLARQILDFFRAYLLEDRMRSARNYLENFAPFLEKNLRCPPELLAEIDGVLAGMRASGVDLRIPALGRVFGRTELLAINAYIESRAARSSCTQFAFWGERTAGGKLAGELIAGRNMDGEIDLRKVTVSHFVIFAVTPSEKGCKRFVSLMWPGFVGTLSGFNEEGFYAMENAGGSGPGPVVGGLVPVAWFQRRILEQAGRRASPEQIEALIDHYRCAGGGSCGPGSILLFARPPGGPNPPAFVYEGDRFGGALRLPGAVPPRAPGCIMASNHHQLYGVEPGRPGISFGRAGSFSSRWRYEAGCNLIAAWARSGHPIATAEVVRLLQSVTHGTTEHSVIFRPGELSFNLALDDLASDLWDAPFQPWTTYRFEELFRAPSEKEGEQRPARAAMEPTELRCEQRRDPLGVEVRHPRLSWALAARRDDARDLRQSAYRILVASSEGKLAPEEADCWDSARVASERSALVPYGGRALQPARTYFWRVRIWDQGGRPSPWSPVARWSSGLFAPGDWRARWIAAAQPDAEALPLLRREITLAEAPQKARIFVCGLGQYELFINGEKVGDRLLEPGWTNYRKTCQYSSYELAGRLRAGANAIGAMLGNGMYNVRGGRYAKFRASFGEPKLIFQLHLEFAGGATRIVASDADWKSAPGPITFSCIYGGEDHDARREPPGWTRPGFDDASWRPVRLVEGPGGALRSQSAPPIRALAVLPVKAIEEPRPGIFVYDFGQNLAGQPMLAIEGPPGSRARLIPGELLDAAGTVSQANIGAPSYFEYTLAGRGRERWAPRFSYSGFRYLQVEGAVPAGHANPAGRPLLHDLRVRFTRAAAERSGRFECSCELFNRIHRLVDWSIGSNLQSVITDCPHREKLGWLEVPHLMGPSILYSYDAAGLLAKIARDMREAQLEDGMVPCIAPEYVRFQGGFRYSPEWSSALVIVPWQVYRWSGDERILAQNYGAMKRYGAFLVRTARQGIARAGLGDWCDFVAGKPPGNPHLTPPSVTSTAIACYDFTLLAKIAAALGHPREAESFRARAGEFRRAFQRAFLDAAGGGRVAGGSQTAQAMALFMDLVPRAQRGGALEVLVGDLHARGWRQSAGDIGHRYLLRALADAGRSDIVHAMTNRRDVPGYGAILAAGATSLSETWDANPHLSLNHCMLGHIQEWFHRSLGGIRPAQGEPGWRHVRIEPACPAGLTWVRSSYSSPHGEVRSSWKRRGGAMDFEITLPPNTGATVVLPAPAGAVLLEGDRPMAPGGGIHSVRPHERGVALEIGSGHYRFTVQNN